PRYWLDCLPFVRLPDGRVRWSRGGIGPMPPSWRWKYERVNWGLSKEQAEACARHCLGRELPDVFPTPTGPKRNRKVPGTKARIVPAFKSLILEKFANKPPSTAEIEIHFDDIRERCYDGENVPESTIRRSALYPTRQVADFPYSIREKTKGEDHYAIVK